MNGYTRGVEHTDGYRRKKENLLWKHDKAVHGGRGDVEYEMRVIKNFGRDNMRRKIDESVRIDSNEGVTMKSKKEYRQPTVLRVEIRRGRRTL